MIICQIKEVLSCQEIQRNNFLSLLQSEARLVNIQDIMQASLFLLEDGKYVQESYRKEYIKAYTLGFITRINEVKAHRTSDNQLLDLEEVQEAVNQLLKQEEEVTGVDGFDPAFFRIYKIISLYTTFIIEEPVHQVGTPFPGGLEVKYDGKNYLCPVKERQKDNPRAVCGFCIAEQDPETI
ncbi:MAG: DUF2115 domain-containing protein [Methanobacterium sp.]|nr:DUF2115 domain-containing protein [Methanobacterium sp.]